MTKYIFFTGGGVSSVGKGVTAAALEAKAQELFKSNLGRLSVKECQQVAASFDVVVALP